MTESEDDQPWVYDDLNLSGPLDERLRERFRIPNVDTWAPNLRKALESIINRCERAGRYTTPEELAEDISETAQEALNLSRVRTKFVIPKETKFVIPEDAKRVAGLENADLENHDDLEEQRIRITELERENSLYKAAQHTHAAVDAYNRWAYHRIAELEAALNKLLNIADEHVDQALGPINELLVFDITYDALKPGKV